MRLRLGIALAMLVAAPASAHLVQRGTPLSELAASSPVAVVGTVASTVPAGDVVELRVEQAVVGGAPSERLRFGHEGHHPPPRYEVGSRVLVFLASDRAPWVSRQSSLDSLVLPESGAEQEALLSAVRDYAGLRAVAEAGERLARLKGLALRHLESPSARVRRDALLDLVAIASRVRFQEGEIARLGELAARPSAPDLLAPGLVVLLAAIREPGAERALHAVLQGKGDPQARARAARVIARREGPAATATLRALLTDPAPAVSATARHELARLGAASSPRAATAAAKATNPTEGKGHVQPEAPRN